MMIVNPYRFAAPAPGGDPYWANVVHLLHFDGAPNGVVFTDSAGAEWTASGTAKTVADAEAFGGSAGFFDGAGYIQTPYDAGRSLGGAAAFTIELFVAPTALTDYQSLVGAWYTDATAAFRLLTDSAGRLRFDIRAGGSTLSTPWSASGVLSVGNLSYVAVRWTGTGYEVWRDGATVTSLATTTAPQASTSPLSVGRNIDANTWYARALIDEMRITAGVARDVSTAPTVPFPNN